MLASAFMRHAIAADGAQHRYIHADDGTSMTSKNVATLLSDLNIDPQRFPPHVSDDNPYSEAIFKTLKYCPSSWHIRFPGRPAVQRHLLHLSTLSTDSGIGLHTPATVHDGTAWTIRSRRQQVLDDAFAARRPVARPRAQAAGQEWINKPRPTIETQGHVG